jgi:hypothetical protein
MRIKSNATYTLNFGRNPLKKYHWKKRKQVKNIQGFEEEIWDGKLLKLDIDRSDISNFVRLRISNI